MSLNAHHTEDGRFKTAAALTVGPVRRMQVEPSGHQTTWHGRNLRFCSEGCRTEFLAAPARVLS